MFYVFVISCLILPSVNLEEIVTFQNKEYYLCVVDSTEKTIHIEPPSITEARNSTILIEDDTLWPDWSLKDSSEIIVPGVTDKRWEDFRTFYQSNIYLESLISFGFSTTTPSARIFVMYPERLQDIKKSDSYNSNVTTWYHHLIKLITEADFHVNVTASTDVYWKIHDYKVRFADHVTKNETTVFTVNPNIASCVNLYTYFCTKCILKVTINSSDHTENYFLNSNGDNWHSIEIKVDTEKQIKLVRSTTDKSEIGTWVVDFRKCNHVANRGTHKILTSDSSINRSCHTFDFVQTTQIKKVTTDESIFGCDAGTLGKNCNMLCEDVLGANYRRCEGHKICDNSNGNAQCFCAWGFTGENCDERCLDGAWGLSCQNNCTKCDNCDKATGDCITNGSEATLFFKSLLLISMLAFSLS